MRNIKERLDNFVDKVAPTKFFLVVALFFGLLFIIITPPFQTPDEPVHFYRAYQISELNFVVDNGVNITGGYLPKSLDNTVTFTTTNPVLSFQQNQKYDMYNTFGSFSIKTNAADKKFYNFPASAAYPPTAYIPQATGIGIGRLVGTPPIGMMYLSRIFNLITWVVIFALAIQMMPRKKWAVVFLGLLPMSLFQAGSQSTDVMAIGTMLLFFAYILKLRESKSRLSNQQITILLAIASLMVLTKQVMFIFLPLIFLLPHTVFTRKRAAYLAKAAILGLPLLLLALWALITSGVSAPYTYENGQFPMEQLKFILHNPHSYINVLWNTSFFTWGDLTFRSFIGSFGTIDTPLSEFIATIGYVGLAFVFLLNTKSKKIQMWLSSRQKLLIALVIFLYWLAVNTALYVYFTTLHYKIVLGLQGRYFLPMAILAIPLLYGGWLMASRTAYRRIVISTPLLLLVASFITIYVRFYVKNV